jgi:membrane associated rhomboid family serine protease
MLLVALGGGAVGQVLVDEAGLGSLFRWLALYPSRVAHGQLWRLLTYPLVAAPLDLLSLIFSIFAVYSFGCALEARLSSRRFVLFTLALTCVPSTVGTLVNAFHPTFFVQPVAGPWWLALGMIIAWATYFPAAQIYLLPPQIAGRFAPIVSSKTFGVGIAIFEILRALVGSPHQSPAYTIAAVANGYLLAANWHRIEAWLDRRGRALAKNVIAKSPKPTHKLRVIRGGLDSTPPPDKRFLN